MFSPHLFSFEWCFPLSCQTNQPKLKFSHLEPDSAPEVKNLSGQRNERQQRLFERHQKSDKAQVCGPLLNAKMLAGRSAFKCHNRERREIWHKQHTKPNTHTNTTEN